MRKEHVMWYNRPGSIKLELEIEFHGNGIFRLFTIYFNKAVT